MNVKFLLCCFLGLFLMSCQVTETLFVEGSGAGEFVVELHRVEQSYQQLAGEEYNKNEVFVDTTYVFDDYIIKYNETFSRLTPEDKAVFNAYKGVQVQIKKNSFEKEFRTVLSQKFSKASEIADLYKTERYVSDIVHNYALSAEEDYYKVAFEYKGNQFKRLVTITNQSILKSEQERLAQYQLELSKKKVHQKLTLRYRFPKKIASVSVSNAIISPDRKEVEINFGLIESMIDPESTSVTILFE